ncbi:hypothetical protein Bhyg_02461 [Pseudolycoriella hygida]|uniref:Chitin-binding type-2 domain-containing protein n=1 Tax=Pseudolycoriella hygida TaxID=35572 RepID=A0A9Q0S8E3_9DIPT|nr:hypothetical protein Bhyg_02461 [Pseudolycoriella hygida]
MKAYHCCILVLACVALAAAGVINKTDDLKNDPPPPPVPFCPAQCLWHDIYNFPHFTNCNRYYHCIHGFFFDFPCGQGEEFDHISLQCLPAAEARCIFEGPTL